MDRPYRYQSSNLASSWHHLEKSQSKKPDLIVPVPLTLRENRDVKRGDVLVDGRKLYEMREALLLTQGQFADKIGTSPNWVRETERLGTRRVLRKRLGDVADALNVDPHSLIAKDEPSAFELAPGEKYTMVKTRKYPVFAVKIPAGRWAESEPRSLEDADGFVLLDANDTPDDAFVLRINGDCMEPEYPCGSVLVFAPVREGEGVTSFQGGRDYYVEHSDGKSTFKRVYFEQRGDDGFFKLVPLNPKYEPIEVPRQMIARMSRAIKQVNVRNLG